ncbi:hypothetical protein OIU78_019315 [Salix suchowensis]|nr:hypothetical protein OIU78_019315 [Salix suchowensis]
MVGTTMVEGQGTRVGFYATTCRRAESIVRATVQSHFTSDSSIAPGLLRMHFHDCFVNGYILALAARDSVVLTNGLSWPVPTGRRDGRVSLASDASNLPGFTDSVDVQKQKFAAFGLNTLDLVTLVGGHTIGTTACQFFRYRLYNFTTTGNGADPSINPAFVSQLQALCPQNGDGSRRIALDTGSQNRFDSSFFANLRSGRGILESDQKLWTDATTRTFCPTPGWALRLVPSLAGLW